MLQWGGTLREVGSTVVAVAAAAAAATVAGLRRARRWIQGAPLHALSRGTLRAPLQRLMRSCSFEMSSIRPSELASVSCSHPSNMASCQGRRERRPLQQRAAEHRGFASRRLRGAQRRLTRALMALRQFGFAREAAGSRTSCISPLPPTPPAGGRELPQGLAPRSARFLCSFAVYFAVVHPVYPGRQRTRCSDASCAPQTSSWSGVRSRV